jgi:hypothetical protein
MGIFNNVFGNGKSKDKVHVAKYLLIIEGIFYQYGLVNLEDHLEVKKFYKDYEKTKDKEQFYEHIEWWSDYCNYRKPGIVLEPGNFNNSLKQHRVLIKNKSRIVFKGVLSDLITEDSFDFNFETGKSGNQVLNIGTYNSHIIEIPFELDGELALSKFHAKANVFEFKDTKKYLMTEIFYNKEENGDLLNTGSDPTTTWAYFDPEFFMANVNKITKRKRRTKEQIDRDNAKAAKLKIKKEKEKAKKLAAKVKAQKAKDKLKLKKEKEKSKAKKKARNNNDHKLDKDGLQGESEIASLCGTLEAKGDEHGNAFLVCASALSICKWLRSECEFTDIALWFRFRAITSNYGKQNNIDDDLFVEANNLGLAITNKYFEVYGENVDISFREYIKNLGVAGMGSQLSSEGTEGLTMLLCQLSALVEIYKDPNSEKYIKDIRDIIILQIDVSESSYDEYTEACKSFILENKEALDKIEG